MPASPAHAKALKINARRRRRNVTAVHAALDALDWTIADLALAVSHELPTPVSRSSVQNWATGTRQVGPRGRSESHPCAAPLEVRVAAENVTKRVARERKIGDMGIIRADDWPNIEVQ